MYSIYVLTKVVISALYNLLAQIFFETEQNQQHHQHSRIFLIKSSKKFTKNGFFFFISILYSTFKYIPAKMFKNYMNQGDSSYLLQHTNLAK